MHEAQLRELWASVIGVEAVSADANFFEVGGDSLTLLRLMDEVEARWGVRFSHDAVLADPTIGGMASALSGERVLGERSAVFALKPRGPVPPLFLVTAGYGDLVSFRALAGALGPGIPVYACQPPDSLSDGVSLEDLVACYCEGIRAVQPVGPYRLAGYSIGGRIALEVAVALRAHGDEVELLAALDSESYTGRRAQLAIGLSRFVFRQLIEGHSMLEGRVARVAQFVVRDRGFDLHVQAVLRRQPAEFDGSIDLIVPRFSPQRLRFRQRGWRAVAKGGVQVHVMPGDHENFIRPPHVRKVAELLRQRLRQGTTARAAGAPTTRG